MPIKLIITVLLFALILLIVVVSLLKKDKISVKYALVWMFAILFILIVSLIPNLMTSLAKFLGFELLSNMVLCVFVAMLLFLDISLTIMCSNNKKKTTLLIQEVSVLKKELEDKKK